MNYFNNANTLWQIYVYIQDKLWAFCLFIEQYLYISGCWDSFVYYLFSMPLVCIWYIYYHHHNQVILLAWISLILSRHLSLCPVSWGCKIHRLHLCRGVRPPNKCPDMTLNNLIVRFQWYWSFREWRAPFHCHCSIKLTAYLC